MLGCIKASRLRYDTNVIYWVMPGIERKKSKEFKQLVLEKYIWLSNGRINLLPSKQININDLVDVYVTFKAL